MWRAGTRCHRWRGPSPPMPLSGSAPGRTCNGRWSKPPPVRSKRCTRHCRTRPWGSCCWPGCNGLPASTLRRPRRWPPQLGPQSRPGAGCAAASGAWPSASTPRWTKPPTAASTRSTGRAFWPSACATAARRWHRCCPNASPTPTPTPLPMLCCGKKIWAARVMWRRPCRWPTGWVRRRSWWRFCAACSSAAHSADRRPPALPSICHLPFLEHLHATYPGLCRLTVLGHRPRHTPAAGFCAALAGRVGTGAVAPRLGGAGDRRLHEWPPHRLGRPLPAPPQDHPLAWPPRTGGGDRPHPAGADRPGPAGAADSGAGAAAHHPPPGPDGAQVRGRAGALRGLGRSLRSTGARAGLPVSGYGRGGHDQQRRWRASGRRPACAAGTGAHAPGGGPPGRAWRRHRRLTAAMSGTPRCRLSLYLDLIRWNRPAGWLVCLWPTLSALWVAADGFPGWHLLLVFVLGTCIMRSAGCCVNDVAVRDFDRHVKRTAQRPVTTGAVGVKEALAVGAVLALLAFGLALSTNAATIAWSVPALLVAIAYPYAKRLVSMPQTVLGIAFNFGIVLAFAAVQGRVPAVAWWLWLGTMFWVLAYDTEYAMVDRDDDLKIGIKTSAITLGRLDVAAIMLCYLLFLSLWVWALHSRALGALFYIAIAAALAQALWHWRLIRQRTRAGCFAAFRVNHWLGCTVFAGIAGSYLVRHLQSNG